MREGMMMRQRTCRGSEETLVVKLQVARIAEDDDYSCLVDVGGFVQ